MAVDLRLLARYSTTAEADITFLSAVQSDSSASLVEHVRTWNPSQPIGGNTRTILRR